MSNKIIDEVQGLMELSIDELDEVLLDDKYNKANLRELVRRTLKEASKYKTAFHTEKQEHDKYKKSVSFAIGKIKN